MKEFVLLRDLAVVMSSELYAKSTMGTFVSRRDRRIEYDMKSDAGKRSICEVKKSIDIKNNSAIIIPKRGIDVFFISLILDSRYTRTVLLDGQATIRKLINLPVVAATDADKEYYSELEINLLSLSKVNDDRVRYEYFYAAERLFADIRDGIVFELYQPELLHSANIFIFDYWKMELDSLHLQRIEKGYSSLLFLVNSILRPGNQLYDNLKRLSLLMDKYNG